MSDYKLKLLEISASMVSSQIKDKPVDVDNIQNLVQTFYRALKKVYDGIQNYKLTGPLHPAVSVEESIHDDYIICLEDGKKLQMLKRHLNTVYNMTPEQYRERWSLPPDYPMVAPSYAKRRSAIAKETGLGVTNRRAPGPRKKIAAG